MTPYPFIYYYVYALPTNVYYVCVVNMYNEQINIFTYQILILWS